MKLTHVTQFGLATCAGKVFPPGRSNTRRAVRARLRRLGLRPDVVACDGTPAGGRYFVNLYSTPKGDVLLSASTPRLVPTCPRCAVLRDEALEGRLPKNPETA